MNLPKHSFERILIIGNSGSGKTFLARMLSVKLKSKVIHFDEHFWEPGGFTQKRPAELVQAEIKELSLGPQWIMEGVFGELAAIAMERATALLFLNKLWSECKDALERRGPQLAGQIDQEAALKSYQELLVWAEAYYQRENMRSLKGHMKLFAEFNGAKLVFKDREAVERFVSGIDGAK